MEHQITVINGEIVVDKMDVLMGLLSVGFSIAIVIIVVVAAARIGWKLAPWILGLGFLAWLLF